MWTTRLKGSKLSTYIKEILEQIDTKDFEFFDPEIAGGQIVSVAEEIVGAEFVSGISANAMDINYATTRLGLQGNYKVGNFLQDDVPDLSGKIAIGNPPYNDDSVGRNPIYDKYLARLVTSNVAKLIFIIPTNWLSQTHTKLGREVREHLRNLGIQKIIINPEDLFEGVKVGTCTVVCDKEYNGDVLLVNGTTKESIVIDDFDEQILTVFDVVTLELLQRLKPSNPYITKSGAKDTDKWRISTSYRKENFEIEPLNTIKVMEPNYKSQKGYRVFEAFDTKEEAEVAVEFYKSFWHSKLIKFIMRKTRTSTTLDNPQLFWIPTIDRFDKKFTDQDLYKHFGLTDTEIAIIEK